MADDKRGRACGTVVPPPLIYVGPLVLGLLLGKAIPLSFLPRGLSRILGWPILAGGVLLLRWFASTLRRAETTIRIDRPVSRLVTSGPFRHSRNPGYLSFALIYAGIAYPEELALGDTVPPGGTGDDAAHDHRQRGALPGAPLRTGVPALQGAGAPVAVGVGGTGQKGLGPWLRRTI